jgi:6-phosphogluconolactonase
MGTTGLVGAVIGSALLIACLKCARTAEAGAPSSQGDQVMFAYVGSFTTVQRKARGDGIHVFRVEADSGLWTHIQHIANLTNPSFLALSPNQSFLYAVHGDGDYATAFALDRQAGVAKLLNRAATGGNNGVRQAVDPAGKFLIVANYASGSIAVLAIAPDGSLKEQQQLVTLRGEAGPHKIEQASSHPHDIVIDPSGRFVLVPDKGLDRVFVFGFDNVSGRLSPAEPDFIQTRPGAGPRHLAFHPRLPVVWVLNELDSTTTTYRWDADQGRLTPVQVVTTLPTDFAGYSTAAEIAVSPDGRFVYASNRGHDSVAVYATNASDGTLTSVGWQPTQGRVPRFISLDPTGRFLLAANEQGDTVVTFRVDAASGTLAPTGQVIKIASPVSIVFAGRHNHPRGSLERCDRN